jgi:hypothetical protein
VTRGYRPGRKIITVLAGLLAGADCIDDLAVRRAGCTDRILPTTPMAPSTIGTCLPLSASAASRARVRVRW